MTFRRLALILAALGWVVLLTACGSSNSSSQTHGLADGTYVFHLAGEDYYPSLQATSPYFAAGAFTVSAGAITAGEEDFIDYYSAFNALAIQPAGSSISVTTDGNLQILLFTGLEGVGVNGTQTINAALVTSSSARIAEFDAAAAGTGSLDPQSSVAQPAGGYAFFAAGVNTKTLPLAMGGIINIDNLNGTTGTISGAGSVFDLNNAPTLGLFAAQAFSASAVSTPDSFGRVLFTLNPSNASIGQIQLVGYVADSTTIQLVEARDALLGTMGGTALSQGSNAGMFSGTSLSGSAYVAGAQGQETVGGHYKAGGPLLNLAGAIAFNAGSSIGGTVSFNDLSTSAVPTGNIVAGTYAVDTNPGTGRVTISGLTATYTANNTTTTYGPVTLQLYLDGNGNAFVVSMDSNDVTAGVAFQQTASASVSGSYAVTANGTTVISTTTYPWSAVGVVSASSGTATGFTDLNVLSNPEASGSQIRKPGCRAAAG